ncbi:unnamed protein product [Allacma fusca]|uniref:Uncharacterized protein n=1 Tax=Allacma fusca TaxID=39272 RepID=A0A8J2KN58_9HEXA|nr:unnamed protein product [Allacma fusca]
MLIRNVSITTGLPSFKSIRNLSFNSSQLASFLNDDSDRTSSPFLIRGQKINSMQKHVAPNPEVQLGGEQVLASCIEVYIVDFDKSSVELPEVAEPQSFEKMSTPRSSSVKSMGTIWNISHINISTNGQLETLRNKPVLPKWPHFYVEQLQH